MSFPVLIIFLCFIVPAFLLACYHLALGTVALFQKTKKHSSRVPKTRFVVLIPAHNEELSITDAVQSILNADYPQELIDIYVIADNCTDNTATVAQEQGANVIVRNNPEKRGKGYALNKAIKQILDTEIDFDGFFIVDSDAHVEKEAFRSLDYFARKKPGIPLQLKSVPTQSDETPLSYFLAVANCLENDFFYAPKSILGLFILLRGTGMFFPKRISKDFPWNPKSIVEDVDMTLLLLENGISVQFVAESAVFSEYPEEKETMEVQRKRWIGGTFTRIFTHGLTMMFSGLFASDKVRLDAGITFCVLSRPVLLFHLVLTTLSSLILILASESSWGKIFLVISMICWLFYTIYFSFGVFRLGLSAKRIKLLCSCPKELMSYLIFSLRSIVSKSSKEWKRTPRKAEKTK